MFAYLKLLVKQRLALWNPARNLRNAKSKWKVVLSYIGFTLGMLALYGMLVGMEYLLYGAFVQLGEPQTLLALTGIVCTLLVIVTSFFFVLSELFFSRDIPFVSALPITSRGLLGAKLIRIWIGEAGIALLVCLPVVILYGIGHAMGVFYYLAAIILIPLLSVAPLAVVTLLSFALIRVSALWKRRELLTIVASMAFLIAFLYAEMRLSLSAEGSDLGALVLQLVLRQKQMLDLVVGIYPPIQLFTSALTNGGGSALLHGIMFAGLNISIMAVVWVLLGNGYQRLAVRQQESLARLNASKRRVGKQRERSPLTALYVWEMREILTVPVYAMNSLASAVIFPVLFAVMVVSGGQTSAELAMLPALAAMVPKPVLIAIIAALLTFLTSMNMAVATSVSREGKRHEFFQTLPVKPRNHLLAKLLMGLTVNMLCVLPITVILLVAIPSLALTILLGFVVSCFFSTAMASFALMVDARHPRFGWKNETEAIKQNGIAALTMFGSMGFIVLCGAAFYGLLILNVAALNALLIVMGIALGLDVFLINRLMKTTANTYIHQEIRN